MTKNASSSTSTSVCGSRSFFCCLALLAVISGCGSNNQRLTQLQNENDRLLNEFRAQRDQVAQLNEKLALAQNRLAESEKLLARQSPMPSSRLSRLNDPSSLPGPAFGSPSRGTTSGSAAGIGGTAAASKPGNPKVAGGESNANSASDLYWRPMRREAP